MHMLHTMSVFHHLCQKLTLSSVKGLDCDDLSLMYNYPLTCSLAPRSYLGSLMVVTVVLELDFGQQCFLLVPH